MPSITSEGLLEITESTPNLDLLGHLICVTALGHDRGGRLNPVFNGDKMGCTVSGMSLLMAYYITSKSNIVAGHGPLLAP